MIYFQLFCDQDATNPRHGLKIANCWPIVLNSCFWTGFHFADVTLKVFQAECSLLSPTIHGIIVYPMVLLQFMKMPNLSDFHHIISVLTDFYRWGKIMQKQIYSSLAQQLRRIQSKQPDTMIYYKLLHIILGSRVFLIKASVVKDPRTIAISAEKWLNMGEYAISRLVQDSLWVSQSGFFLTAFSLLEYLISSVGLGLWAKFHFASVISPAVPYCCQLSYYLVLF